jgi:beta-lactam-binding protein with PASTA domain
MRKAGQEEGFLNFLKSHAFIRQLLIMAGALIVLLVFIQLWLRIYTHHGQKLELPDFKSMSLEEGIDLAESEDFELMVIDSVFLVGKAGGIITEQYPKPGSLVKEGRKIYITITKYNTETIQVGDLPVLYGNAFEQKQAELQYRDINSVVKDYAYDPGEPNHILEVWYKGELIISGNVKRDEVAIDKGGKLEFVLSQRDGGEIPVPDLICMTLDEARFSLDMIKLQLGSISRKGSPQSDDASYITNQNPVSDGVTTIKMGSVVSVTVSGTKPESCN